MSLPLVTAGVVLLGAEYVGRIQPTADMATLDPAFRAKAEPFLAAAEKQGTPLTILETRRSLERQVWLWLQGRLRPGPIVTNAITKGRHLTGSAFDTWPRGYGFTAAENATVIDKLMGLAPLARSFGLKNLPEISDYGHWEDA